MRGVHYDSYTKARTHLKDLLDAAERGRVATIRRESTTAAVVDADRLRRFLASLTPVRAQVVAEAGGRVLGLHGERSEAIEACRTHHRKHCPPK